MHFIISLYLFYFTVFDFTTQHTLDPATATLKAAHKLSSCQHVCSIFIEAFE